MSGEHRTLEVAIVYIWSYACGDSPSRGVLHLSKPDIDSTDLSMPWLRSVNGPGPTPSCGEVPVRPAIAYGIYIHRLAKSLSAHTRYVARSILLSDANYYLDSLPRPWNSPAIQHHSTTQQSGLRNRGAQGRSGDA
ncbi:hypothetical protein B0H13DRAFT_2319922 [Mycena leptocephala]|nr:hypothetical protein B0H13DRAFT_2319922 [Mycena leptocephala]